MMIITEYLAAARGKSRDGFDALGHVFWVDLCDKVVLNGASREMDFDALGHVFQPDLRDKVVEK
jgi:hypothetical protein